MRYNRTGNFWPFGNAESKKTQKFVFRSVLRPNQISFSHSQDPSRKLGRQFCCDAQRLAGCKIVSIPPDLPPPIRYAALRRPGPGGSDASETTRFHHAT